ncbi:hypothetical protein ACTJKC_03500 [Pedobacter sp. 22226]
MTKSDNSKYSICIGAIKTNTIQPYDFKWSKFHDTNVAFYELYPNILIEVDEA